ncbi:MAG: NAD-dependent epimerase/dehydratase family protein [Magnetococcales bacterium]|nr:NAD-dependent epimerase/dehydratase family protein [Magnetococcales bacterium]
MRHLVIGGNGFIGANLTRLLTGQGEMVRVYHRPASSLAYLQDAAYQFVAGELDDAATLSQAIAASDVVYNLAGCLSTLKKDHAQRSAINVQAAARIARLCHRSGVRLVHVSSIAAVGSPPAGVVADEEMVFNRHHDPYALTKWQGEQAVLAEARQGLEVIVACPGNVVGGLGMKSVQKNNFLAIRAGKMKFYPPGGVCLTDIDDLVRGLYGCATKGRSGCRYILGGHNISFRDYFNEIALATGGVAPWMPLPGKLLPFMGWGVEMVFALLERDPPVNRDTGDVVSRKMYYSSQRAIDELDYTIGDWQEAVRKAARMIE